MLAGSYASRGLNSQPPLRDTFPVSFFFLFFFKFKSKDATLLRVASTLPCSLSSETQPQPPLKWKVISDAPIKAEREPRGRWDSPWRITQLSGCEVRKKMNQEGKAGASLQRLHPVISLSSPSPPSGLPRNSLRVFPGPLFYTFQPLQRVATDRFPFSERRAPLRHPRARTAGADVPFPSTAPRPRLPGLPRFLRSPPDATLATSSP